MSTFRNNHNPTRSSPLQDLFYSQLPSVRLIPVIQPTPLPCITYQVSADHLCTNSHCSLWVARGQDLQKILARAGQTHWSGLPRTSFTSTTPQSATFQMSMEVLGIQWSHRKLQSTKYRLVTLQRACSIFQEFSASQNAWSVCHMEKSCPGPAVPAACSWVPDDFLPESWPHPVCSWILQSSFGFNLSIDLLTPWSGTDILFK